jgi:hypothetical protein
MSERLDRFAAMDKTDTWALVLVAGFAALLGYGVAKDAIGIGQAAVVMACLLVFFALGASMTRPSLLTLAKEGEAEPAQGRFPIGFQPPSWQVVGPGAGKGSPLPRPLPV